MFVVCSLEISSVKKCFDRRAASERPQQGPDCQVAPIAEQTSLTLLLETPLFALTVMRTLADRLRRTSASER
jgi:hypothetical protein